MNTTCKQLKELRRKIAKDNGIDIEIADCDMMDQCTGTCPGCEAELQTLERELTLRVALGRVAVVAGMTLGLTAGMLTASAQNSNIENKATTPSEVSIKRDTCLFKGMVREKETDEPLAFANVILRQNGDIVTGTATDLDGQFSLQVPVGKYELIVSFIGYRTSTATIELDSKQKEGVSISIQRLSKSNMLGMIVIEKKRIPLLEIGASESGERIDADRIKHFPN